MAVIVLEHAVLTAPVDVEAAAVRTGGPVAKALAVLDGDTPRGASPKAHWPATV